MKHLNVSHALSLCVAAILSAGCGGLQPPIGAPAMPQAAGIAAPESAAAAHTRATDGSSAFSITPASAERVLHRFGRGLRGAGPDAGLIDVDGTLYGTTVGGGKYSVGTVFGISTTGTEYKVLHIFAGGSDGAIPEAGLIDVDGTMYGTTFGGGKYGVGTVFSITTAGTEKVLNSFAGGSDGANPQATLINVNGVLYGTTAQGGRGCVFKLFRIRGCGTIFSVTTTGMETVLYRFRGSRGDGADGAVPLASLINVKGTLYGTTAHGGSYCGGIPPGCGTVFSITTAGTEKVLHSFGARSDGEQPLASLINVKGMLYGTTFTGTSRRTGNGTVYSVTTTGTEKVLYSFTTFADGNSPEAGLVDLNGTLYGTTAYGSGSFGNGTAYAVSLSGKERVLHRFGGIPDGQLPVAGLIAVNGTLYGTTAHGGTGAPGGGCSGAGFGGCGTVFSLKP